MRQKKYEQMDQMDRIEYLLLKKENNFYSISMPFAFYTLFFIMLSIILAWVIRVSNPTLAQTIFTMLVSSYRIFLYVILVLIVYDMAMFIIHLIKQDKLEKHFLRKNGINSRN